MPSRRSISRISCSILLQQCHRQNQFCESFLSDPGLSRGGRLKGARNRSAGSRLKGISEWRDQSLESYYSLDIYQQRKQQSTNDPSFQSEAQQSDASPQIPAEICVLPFPFSDILLQGERTQLNLYEDRFHRLFEDVMENYCGVVGMGLLAGNGMITTLPLCEVESFSRFGGGLAAADRAEGMGDGSIFVTIKAVARAKIVESELTQESPYIKARVVEVCDDGTLAQSDEGLEVGSIMAGNIENLMVSLASMEHRLKMFESDKREEEQNDATDEFSAAGIDNEGDGGMMSRRIINAKLESLLVNDESGTGPIDGSFDIDNEDDDDDAYDEEDDENEDEEEADEDEKDDRVTQFQKAFESAKEADSLGYIVKATFDGNGNNGSTTKNAHPRTPKDLTAISWAAFNTGDNGEIKRDVFRIQALDMTNVVQRLQLASAMLREEKKKLKAKLALAGMKDSSTDEES